jgi:hypothetical protein
MRDLLPELAADRLSGAALARVAAHVNGCDACAAELDLLRVARRTLGRDVPTIDVNRIVAALPKPPVERATTIAATAATATTRTRTRRILAVRSSPSRTASSPHQRTTWTAWRIAAVATVAVGGLSVAVLRGPSGGGKPVGSPAVPSSPPAAVVSPPAVTNPSASAPAPAATAPAPAQSSVEAPATVTTTAEVPPATNAKEGLAVAGDISDLSDGEIETLLQGMDAVDAEPAAEPEESAPAIAAVAP